MKTFRLIKPHLSPVIISRFWDKVEKSQGCWTWNACRLPNGYGQMNVGGGLKLYAHRISYVLVNGEIPEGKDLDHLCRNRACVNPIHLEAVSRKENLLRGETIPAAFANRDSCVNGHLLTGSNVYSAGGYRSCRECHKLREQKRRDRIKAAA